MRSRSTGARLVHSFVAVIVLAVGCEAAATVAPSAASAYIYRAGDPMFLDGPASYGHACTGGYTIRGGSGTFLLTAGHCADVGAPIYGTGYKFGSVAYTKCGTAWWCVHDSSLGYDTELVREIPPDDAYQNVVTSRANKDHPAGSFPGTGRVVGSMPNSRLTKDLLVGKMGWTTGWTEGRIYKIIPNGWHHMTKYCTTAGVAPGDSGGPVWRTDTRGGIYTGGIDAVGIVVSEVNGTEKIGQVNGTKFGCFVSIEDLLKVWGATLPVWSSA